MQFWDFLLVVPLNSGVTDQMATWNSGELLHCLSIWILWGIVISERWKT